MCLLASWRLKLRETPIGNTQMLARAMTGKSGTWGRPEEAPWVEFRKGSLEKGHLRWDLRVDRKWVW